MKFFLEDTKARYKETLHKMSSDRLRQAGNDWAKAKLGFYFNDDLVRAQFSARDTLVPLLEEDKRVVDQGAIHALEGSLTLDLSAADTVSSIHDSYTASQPLG